MFYQRLPSGLVELRDFLWADTDEQHDALLRAIYDRLGRPIPAAGLLSDRVRVLTMHGAKGLSAKVVFVPGLEEEVLPGPCRQPPRSNAESNSIALRVDCSSSRCVRGQLLTL